MTQTLDTTAEGKGGRVVVVYKYIYIYVEKVDTYLLCLT